MNAGDEDSQLHILRRRSNYRLRVLHFARCDETKVVTGSLLLVSNDDHREKRLVCLLSKRNAEAFPIGLLGKSILVAFEGSFNAKDICNGIILPAKSKRKSNKRVRLCTLRSTIPFDCKSITF